MSSENTKNGTAVCVYCAASPGNRPEFREAAYSLGKAIAEEQRMLVYGGGDRGLMGVVSATVLQHGGKVTGISPRPMVVAGGEGRGPEETHVEAVNDQGVTSIIVESMHERKTMMARMAGAGFVALPGGFGTFEEVLEAITWSQIGIHRKPVVILNVKGYYEPLKALITGGISEVFIQQHNAGLATFIDGPSADVNESEFDWGRAALSALEAWEEPGEAPMFEWAEGKADKLEAA